MKRTSLKVLISASIILAMIPFSFLNVKADENNIYTEVLTTISSSRIYWEEDTSDSRLMIGRQYISINCSPNSTGLAYMEFVSDDARASQVIEGSSLYSLTGIDCDYSSRIYPTSTDVWTYGEKYMLTWSNISTGLLVFEFKILKTYYDNNTDFEYGYRRLTIVGNPDGNITPSVEGLMAGDLQLLIVNENLSDQAVEGYLQQINQNYLPTIIDMLQTIHGAIEAEGNGQYESFIYVKNTARVNATVNNTRYYPTYERTNYYGDGFSIENGKIKCNYDGYVIIASNSYFYRYSSNTTVADIYFRWIKNGTDIGGYNDSIRGGYGGTTCATTDIISVEQGDLLNFSFSTSSQPISYMETSTALIYYLSKDSTLDYSGQLSTIIQKEQLIYETLNEIKGMIPTAEQDEEIDLNYQEITNIDNTVNNITNTYNQDIDLQMENIPLTDLPDHTGTNLINTSNLYNTIFGDLINIPDMKGIIALLILCIVILAILG